MEPKHYRHILNGAIFPFVSVAETDQDELMNWVGAGLEDLPLPEDAPEDAEPETIIVHNIEVPTHKEGKAPFPTDGFVYRRPDGPDRWAHVHVTEIDPEIWVLVEEADGAPA